MSVHQKVAGVWNTATRPYVKRAGAHVPVREAWVKRSGTWQRAFQWDTTPPTPPELALSIHDGRYIDVSTRQPEPTHQSDVALTRVLSGWSNGYPANQYSSGFVYTADRTYPNEPWSELYFNGYNGGTHATNEWHRKNYPPNPTSATDIAGGVNYYFGAWTMDLNGNWSDGTYAQIFMPKNTSDSGGTSTKIVYRARFVPQQAGSIDSGGYHPDSVTTKAGSNGWYFYGGSHYISPGSTITSAQISLYRKNDDGAALANVYLFGHGYTTAPGGGSGGAAIFVGQIAKGEYKWFTIPGDFYNQMINGTIKGWGLLYYWPPIGYARPEDYAVYTGPNDETGSAISGQVAVTWTLG